MYDSQNKFANRKSEFKLNEYKSQIGCMIRKIGCTIGKLNIMIVVK